MTAGASKRRRQKKPNDIDSYGDLPPSLEDKSIDPFDCDRWVDEVAHKADDTNPNKIPPPICSSLYLGTSSSDGTLSVESDWESHLPIKDTETIQLNDCLPEEKEQVPWDVELLSDWTQSREDGVVLYANAEPLWIVLPGSRGEKGYSNVCDSDW